MKLQARPLQTSPLGRYEQDDDLVLTILNGVIVVADKAYSLADALGWGTTAKARVERVGSILILLQAVESASVILRSALGKSKKIERVMTETSRQWFANLPEEEKKRVIMPVSTGEDGLYSRRFDDLKLNKINRDAGTRLKKVNQLLERYKVTTSPDLAFLEDDSSFVDVAFLHSGYEFSGGYWEYRAVMTLIVHMKNGTIGRFRNCSKCSQWFYALTDHQRFCSDKCRKMYASKSDEYRRKRKLYMRRYRQSEKRRAEVELNAVRRGR